MLKYKFFLFISLLLSLSAQARVIYYGSETETITLSYGGPTIFRFNQEVKTISQASKFQIKPADDQEPNYAVLSVKPRFTRGENKVTFLLADGAVINARLVIVPKALPEKIDSFYDFKPKESLIEKNESESNVSELELMKAMMKWDQVAGYNVKVISRSINTGVSGVSAKLVRVYTGPKYNGYIYKISNDSKHTYNIDIRNLSLGRINLALLSQVDQNVLKPKKDTFLQVVAKPSSVYYSVNLPVVQKKSQQQVSE